MKSLRILSLGIFILLSSHGLLAQETTTVYLFRHAEKVKTDPNDRNPHLTTKGVQRSNTWASFFEKIAIDQIYSTPYHRTQETVAQIAKLQNLPVHTYAPSNEVVDSIVKSNLGKQLIFVGHSNTVPGHTNKLLGKKKFKDMSEGDNHSLFIVQLQGEDATVVRIFVD